MPTSSSNLKPYQQALKAFNLSNNEITTYLTLIKTGWITVLNLAKRTKIKRTTLYGVLDSLKSQGLVETKLEDKTTFYTAADPQNLQSAIEQKQQTVTNMNQGLAQLKEFFEQAIQAPNNQPSIRFHRGGRGVEIMEYKIANYENTEIFVYGGLKWMHFVDDNFVKQIRQEHVRNHNIIKEIYNQQFAQPIPDNGQASWTNNVAYIKSCYRHRFINSDILSIEDEILITPDAVYLYAGLAGQDLAVIEVVSPTYARLQRGLFNLAWNQAEKIDKFG